MKYILYFLALYKEGEAEDLCEGPFLSRSDAEREKIHYNCATVVVKTELDFQRA